MHVFVGLSGGVDSSVSAALLKAQGHTVTGVFIKVWHPDFLTCSWRDDRRDAMRVCAALEIPFIELDLSKEYKQHIVDAMVADYAAGRTPNPDALCNKYIKFGAFLEAARSRGADAVATGHYAQICSDADGLHLQEGADPLKDQSYFLWTMPQHVLSNVLFPVGGMPKSEVRKLATKFKLPTATKKDSQGLCFLGPIDLGDFIGHFISRTPGKVLSPEGAVIGTHDGAMIYTLGQRHGFTLTTQSPDAKPLYVVSKSIADNTITVSEEPPQAPAGTTFALTDCVFTIDAEKLEAKTTLTARIRYRGAKIPCTINTINGSTAHITFSQTIDAIASGQSVVVYDGTTCLGGGIVA